MPARDLSTIPVDITLIMTPVSYKHKLTVAERSGGYALGSKIQTEQSSEAARQTAGLLVGARLRGLGLSAFPGVPPLDLDDSYYIQSLALELYPSRPCGWKVGFIHPAFQDSLKAERLSGPIFHENIIDRRHPSDESEVITVPIFEAGSAAVEAEFICEIGHFTPADKYEWTEVEARQAISAIYMGVELAGSPVPDINGLGATFVAADFGNNAGLILGPPIEDWQNVGFDNLQTRTTLDGALVGSGRGASVPGTPIESVRFLLGHLARRGRPMRKGDLISTGATTGVHDVTDGQTACIEFIGRTTFNLAIRNRAVIKESRIPNV